MTGEPMTQPIQPVQTSKPHDKTNLVLGILCIILCAGIFALLYMYMNLNSEYQDLNDKYDQLVLVDNTTSDDTNTNKEIDMADTIDSTESDTNDTTETKSFSFVLSNPGSDRPDVKFTGEMPKEMIVTTSRIENSKYATITKDGFLMRFSESYEDEWGHHAMYTAIGNTDFGQLAYVQIMNTGSAYDYQKKYVSMNEYFKTTGQCEVYGETVDAPCGPNAIHAEKFSPINYLFNVTCEVNLQSDIEVCSNIVESIEFEEVN